MENLWKINLYIQYLATFIKPNYVIVVLSIVLSSPNFQ